MGFCLFNHVASAARYIQRKHEDDPLGGMRVTVDGYAELTRIVKQIAATYCHGRLVSVLEGGYDLEGLAASVEPHIRILNQ